MNPLTVEITGLCDNYVYNYLYIDEATYQSSFGTPEINSAYVRGLRGDDGQLLSDPHEAGSRCVSETGTNAARSIGNIACQCWETNGYSF